MFLLESYSNSLDNETSLKDLFEDSLTTLPDCLLKQNLQTNFETHYEELKWCVSGWRLKLTCIFSYLQELVSKPVLKSNSSDDITTSSTITSNEWMCSTTSIADIEQTLLNIESSDNKDITLCKWCIVYDLSRWGFTDHKLAFSARWSGIGLSLILKHWSQSLVSMLDIMLCDDSMDLSLT